MIIGIPKEIKNHEYRVGATPGLVNALVKAGHQVLVETQAGACIGFSDTMYSEAGAQIVTSAKECYSAEMVLKVKEPQKEEFALLRKDLILFCYLHLAADIALTKVLIEKQVIAIAFETVTNAAGLLPLLAPMSEVAGKVAVQEGATLLQLQNGGKGILLGGIPGVCPGKVVVVGGGVSGLSAALIAVGMGARVTLLDVRLERLREIDDCHPQITTLFSSPDNIEKALVDADLVIGAVLIPGKKAPKVITEAMIKKMEWGSVFVDIAIDQGGSSETSRVTTFSDPTYVLHNVIHYCVGNIPGSVARTSTMGLTNALTPYVLKLANLGYKKALKSDPGFLLGLNVCLGSVTNLPVAEDSLFAYVPPEKFL